MSFLDSFLYIICMLLGIIVYYLLAKNSSLKFRLKVLEKENDELNDLIILLRS